MKGTKRTSVIAIALALVLALSVLVGAGIAPTVNENGTQPVNNEGTADGFITFNVVCDCHGNPVDATITGTAHYVLDPDSVVQPTETPAPTTTPSAEPTPTPTTAVEPSEDQVSTQADDQANDPADDSSDADDPSDENQDQDQEQPKPDPTKDEKFEGKAANIEIAKTLTEENGAKYNLASVDYTVTAAGFETKSGTKDRAAIDADEGKITVELTIIVPVIKGYNWQLEKSDTDAKDSITVYASDMNNAVLIRSQTAIAASDIPEYLGKDFKEIKKTLENKYGKNIEVYEADKVDNNVEYNDETVDKAVFYGVTNNKTDTRIIVVVNEYGNTTALVVNRYFEVGDISDEWSNSDKTATITVYGKDLCRNFNIGKSTFFDWYKYEIEDCKLKVCDAEGTPQKLKLNDNGTEDTQVGLQNEDFTFNSIINKSGNYTVKLIAGTKELTSFTFTVDKIDKDAPTIDNVTYNTTNVINQIDVTAKDEGGSGLAGVYMGAVEFDGKYEKTVSKTETTVEGDNQVTTTYYKITVTGMCNGVEVGEKTIEPEITQADIDKKYGIGNGEDANLSEDASLKAIAISAAKDAFKNGIDKSKADKIAEAVSDGIAATTADGKYAFTSEQLADFAGNTKPEALIIWAKDNAGNYSVLYKLGTAAGEEIIIDTVAPKVTEVTVKTLNDDKYSNSSEINIEATIKDSNIAENGVYATLFKDGIAVEGKEKIELFSTPAKDVNGEVIEGKYEATGSVTVSDGDGYTIVVYAEDEAGNKSYTEAEDGKKTPNEEAAISSAFSVDTVAPKLSEMPKFTLVDDKHKTQTKTNDANFYGGHVEFSLKVDDEHFASGVLEYTKDGNTVEPKASFTKNDLKGGVYTLPKLENDADYQMVSLTLEDEAGNKTVYKFVKDEESKVEPSVEVTAEKTGNYKEYELPLITLDRRCPTVNVTYDNNDVRNDKYFNAERTATITITEHNFKDENHWNFKESDINGSGVYIVCTSNGEMVSEKNLETTGWTTPNKDKPDVHEMTIEYDPDADYKFDVYVVDRAGNYTAYEKKATEDAVSPTDFTVDKTKPTITVTGITNGTAYNGEVAGTVEFSDINFNGGTIKLTRADKNGVYDVTAQHAGATPVRGNGGTVSIANFDRLLTNDGIYTLTATAIDMAGNEADPVNVTFSVNRFGSTYKFDDYLASICDKHIKSVTDDLKITEINPDSITSGTVTITRNGKVIDSGDIAAVLQRSGSASGGWYEYLYTISKDLFKEDGMYKIVVSSKDAAGNEPNSENDEEFEIVFWVDDTPAEIAGIQGLEDAIINAENHTVKFTVRDNIGLKSVTVYCDSKEIAKFGEKDFTAGDLVDAQFTISEASSAQHIRIVAEDLSGNILDTDGTIEGSANTTVSFERDVTVSTNFFVRWFANKPLFFGSIAVIVAAGVGIYFIVAKKHKKEEATAE